MLLNKQSMGSPDGKTTLLVPQVLNDLTPINFCGKLQGGEVFSA